MKASALCILFILASSTALVFAGGGQGGKLEVPPQTVGDEPDCSPTSEVIERLYRQILGRPAEPEAIEKHGARLSRGEVTVRGIVRELALSAEFKDRFISPNTTGDAVGFLSQHLLARGTQTDESRAWVAAARDRGIESVIVGIIDSPEYAKYFGEHGVPGRPVTLRACRFPAQFDQSDIIGDGNRMTTGMTISGDGHITATTKLIGRERGGMFCGKVSLWLLDADGNLIEAVGPDRTQAWCVTGKTARAEERNEKWEADVAAGRLKDVRSIAVLHTAATKEPFDRTRENMEKARQVTKPLY